MINLDLTNIELTPENILKKHNALDIYRRFSEHDLDLGKSIRSPLRHGDTTPSFRLFISNGALLYKDFGGTVGNVFQFVMRKTGLGFIDALKLIDNTLEDTPTNSKTTQELEKFIQQSKIPIEYKPIYQPFCNVDRDYWQQYKISSSQLNKYNVRAAKFIYKNGRPLRSVYTKDNPIYVYHVNDKFRFYQPYNKDYKWFGNLNSNCVYGLAQLSGTSNVLFITSSLKDVMCLDSLGYSAIAPPSESQFIPVALLDQLKNKYRHIYVFYNNDSPGKENSIKYTKMHNLLYINNPDGKGKDPSDVIKTEGVEVLRQIIFDKIKRDKII